MPRNKSRAAEVPDAASTVRHVQEIVRDARAVLVNPTPDNLNECRRRVGEAVNVLRQLQTGLPSGDLTSDSSLRAPLGELRAENARLHVLLDSAAAFHTGWVRLAASMLAGYTAGGEPGKTEPTRRFSMEV